MNETLKNTEDVSRVTWFGYQSFIFTLVRALTISIGSYIMFTISQVDTHISTIVGFLIALVPFYIFMVISKNKYELDIIDLNIKLFGKFFGNILNVVINIVFIFLGSLVLHAISQYINIQYIPNTSSIYVNIIIILPIIYAATKNIATITRISQVVLFYNLGIFILSVTGLIEEFKFDNLLPVFSEDVTSILYSSIIFALSIVTPIFLMTIIPQSKVVKKSYSKLKMIAMFTICSLITIFIIVSTILILGIDIIDIYRYPIFMALRQFSLFTIIERIERFLSLQFLMDVIIFLILTVHFISVSINKLFKDKYKYKDNIFSYITGAGILVLSVTLFKNGVDVNEFISKYYIYILGLGILLPMFITYIGVIIDNIKGKLKQFNSSNSIQ